MEKAANEGFEDEGSLDYHHHGGHGQEQSEEAKASNMLKELSKDGKGYGGYGWPWPHGPRSCAVAERRGHDCERGHR